MEMSRSYATRTVDESAARQEILMPFLERLYLSDNGVGTPGSLAFSTELLQLDSWEKELLTLALQSNDGEAPEFSSLLAECVAFQAKCLTQFQRLEDGNGLEAEEKEQLVSELVTDTAVGLALLEETQRAINGLIQDSEMDDAKKFTSFRNKIGKNVHRLQDEIGPTAVKDAEDLSSTMVSPEADKLQSGSSIAVPDWARSPSQDSTSKRAKRVTNVPQKQKSKLMPLGILLASLIAVWAVVIAPSYTKPVITDLQLADFSGIQIVRQIKSRAPSLFVEVNAGVWNSLTPPDQIAAIEQVATVARDRSFVGIQFRVEGKGTVGSWTLERGPILMQPDETSPSKRKS